MSEPISYRLLDAIATGLRAIRTANGYRTDIGADVRIEAPIATDNATFVGIFATGFDRSATASTPRVRNTACTVVIEAIVASGRSNAMRDAHRVRADLLRALYEPELALPRDPDGSGAGGLTCVSDEIEPRADASGVVVVRITATTNLIERVGGIST